MHFGGKDVNGVHYQPYQKGYDYYSKQSQKRQRMLFREGFRWIFWIWKRDAISVSEKYNESTLQGYRILKSGKGSGTEKGLEEWIQQRHHEINYHWIQFVSL